MVEIKFIEKESKYKDNNQTITCILLEETKFEN
jgi:hypothetical protein